MNKVQFTTFLFLLFTCPIIAQLQVDTSYIETQRYAMTLSNSLYYKNYKVSFDDSGKSPIFFQNSTFGNKIRLKYRWFGLFYTFPISGVQAPDGARPRHFGGTLNFYRPKFLLTLGVNRFKGFSDVNLVNDGQESDAFRDDIVMWYNQIGIIYVLSNKRYSLRSSFKFSGWQKKSKGSLLLGAYANTQSIKADSLIIPLSNFDDFPLEKYNAVELGVGAGYAYTHVFQEKYFATLAVTMNGELRRLLYSTLDDDMTFVKWRFSPRAHIRGSIGYNSEHFFFGLNGYYLPGVDVDVGLNTRITDFRIQLVAGTRFIRRKDADR